MITTLAAITIATSSGQLAITGIADVYGSYNPAHPALERNFQPGTGTAASRANAFALNAAAIDATFTSGRAGAHASRHGNPLPKQPIRQVGILPPAAFDWVYDGG